MEDMKFALLIDAENISPQYIDVILSEANNLGNVIYKRIYGNWTTQQMSGWKNTILDNAIQPIQQYNNVRGKNSSDSALIIDAMDLLYQSSLDGFCIVSSDSDFTRLASRLRESDKYVLGMGESQTPRSFISACNKFVYLDMLYAEAKAEESKDASPAADAADARSEKTKAPCARQDESVQNAKNNKGIKRIRQALIKLTDENSNDNGWINSGYLGNLLIRQFPDFDVRLYGYKKFSQFVLALGVFDVHTTAPAQNKTAKTYYFRLKGNK